MSAFVDEMKIHLKAGRGGNGVERWLHLKGKEYSGPAGGNGGRGGDILVRAVRDIGILSKYRHTKEFNAEDGESGKSKSQEGKNGKDLIIDLPIGSVVTNLRTSKKVELITEGEEKLLLKGGMGGLGNEHFKASTNVKPKEWTPGRAGGEADFFIELELVADAGFVGLPNAGKSSLLNAISNAGAKIGAYQFTTLDPNLGEAHGYIFADIPGLIEGASDGKGLGHKFLRHIKRTRIIIHCVSLEHQNPVAVYHTVRNELESFGGGLAEKREMIVLTKTDLVDENILIENMETLKKVNSNVLAVSVLDDLSVKSFIDSAIRILKQ